MADSKPSTYEILKKVGFFALIGIIAGALISRYLNNDYKPFWEKRLSLSGVVIRKQNGHDAPAAHASVNLIFPHEVKQDYTDLDGKYAFSLTGSGGDSVDIEYMLGNQISRKRIGLDYSKRREQLDTVYFMEGAAAPAAHTGNGGARAASGGADTEKGGFYFRPTGHVDMAVLIPTNTTGYDFENGVSQYFQKKAMSVSTSFFLPSFINRYAASLRNGDPSIFYSLGINRYTTYVCFIDPAVSYSRNTLNDEAFVTASGKYQVVLFNLKTNDISRVVIVQSGAGASQDLALEDLERKCVYLIPTKLGGIAL